MNCSEALFEGKLTQIEPLLRPSFLTVVRYSIILMGLTLGKLAFGQLIPVNIQSTDKVSSLNVVLTRFGPSPTSVTLPSNAINLMVQNYSGVPGETFSLRRHGAGAAATQLPASLLDLHATALKHRDWAMIQLTPGNYVMTFLAHPDWQVAITITAAVQK